MTVDLIVADERIASFILLIRDRKVMLDADLAELYGVTTKRLNEQVRRNIDRFPQDFMFQLNEKEMDDMRSQIATASKRNIRYFPYAFTEHGVIMAAGVLNTKRAIEVSVYVVRVFIRLREMFAANKELALKLAELEHKVGEHDETISSLIAAIRQLMAVPAPSRREVGFKAVEK